MQSICINLCNLWLTYTFTGDTAASNLTVSATLPFTTRFPSFGYLVHGDWSVTNLHSSAFTGSFEGSTTNLVTPDFINATTNRFQVWVDDWPWTNATLDARLYYGIDPKWDLVEIKLYRQPNGKYLSTNMLIVADIEDMNHGLGSGRTIQRDLGEQVWAEYKYGTTAITNYATAGKDIKTYTYDIAVMKINGVPVVTNSAQNNVA
jgi:hypothetical protein